jgi:hypothetical protein
MIPMTIQCTRCDAYLVLPAELVARVQGKTGRVPCHGCGEKIRLEARHGALLLAGARHARDVEIEFDEAPSVRGEQLSLLPPPPQDEPVEEIDAVESVRVPGAPRLSSLPPSPPPSLRLSKGPRPSAHAELRPPRPVAGTRRSSPPPSPSDPFDVLGSLAPVVPLQGVRLTEDGRLVNGADEASPKPRSRMRTWAPLVAAAIFATGLASARVGSMLPLERTQAPKVRQVAALVLESESAVVPLRVPPTGSTEEPRFLAEEADEEAPAAVLSAAGTNPAAKAEVDSPAGAPAGGELAALVPAYAVQAAALPVAAEPGPPSVVGEEPGNEDAETALEPIPTEEAAGAADEAEAELPGFSKAAASLALQHAEAAALSCRQAGDPSGSAKVIVTFAPSGRATSSIVSGAPFAGTATGGCIAARFRSAAVPAFSGEHVTVTKTVSLD